MTPEERRLLDAKTRLFDAALAFTDELRAGRPFQFDRERELLIAAMDYAETVHFVEWLRAKQAEERDKRLSETPTNKQKPS